MGGLDCFKLRPSSAEKKNAPSPNPPVGKTAPPAWRPRTRAASAPCTPPAAPLIQGFFRFVFSNAAEMGPGLRGAEISAFKKGRGRKAARCPTWISSTAGPALAAAAPPATGRSLGERISVTFCHPFLDFILCHISLLFRRPRPAGRSASGSQSPFAIRFKYHSEFIAFFPMHCSCIIFHAEVLQPAPLSKTHTAAPSLALCSAHLAVRHFFVKHLVLHFFIWCFIWCSRPKP